MNPDLSARIVAATVAPEDREAVLRDATSRVSANVPSIRADILAEAARLTTGDRNDAHGDPLPNHARIALIWSAILGVQVTPVQVSLCMAGMKLARMAYQPSHTDSAIDGAAYFAIAAELDART